MFFHAVRELASGPRPAIGVQGRAAPSPHRSFTLTDLGRALLAGRTDWVAAGGRERWVGGIRTARGFAPWRWRHGRGPVRGE